MKNETKTDERIIESIRESIREGAELTAGDTITGCIYEAGEFYDGAARGRIPFEHTVSAADLARTRADL